MRCVNGHGLVSVSLVNATPITHVVCRSRGNIAMDAGKDLHGTYWPWFKVEE